MKNLENLMVSVLKVEEMFNVRGGDGEGETATASSKNNTSQGETEDIIL